MDGSSVTLDKVSIQIEASAKEAGGNIEQLTRTLSELRGAVKGGFNNLSKLADSLEKLKSASQGLAETAKSLESISGVTEKLRGLAEIPNPKGLNKTIENLERLPSTFAKIDSKSLKNVARVSEELSNALSPLANKLGQIGQGYSAVSQLADRYGVSVTKVREATKQSTDYMKMYNNAMDKIKNGFKSIQKSNESMFKSLAKGASSVISKLKQIGLSLLGTRTIFTATRKAVSEYMAMDAELTWKVTNNWKALGAQLAPAIENVTWLFKQFIRVIYSVILALTGIDLIARANEKAMKGWGKAAKDTLGNLQKFDDLNVVEFPKGSGGDDNQLIELDAIDLSPIQKVIDWVRKLRDEIKEAWNSGQWYGVGEILAEGLNAAIKAVDFDWIEEKFKSICKKFGDFLQGVVDNFDWETFGSQLTRQLSLIPRLITTFLNEIPWEELGAGLNKAIANFDVGFLIDSITNSVLALMDGIQKALLQIDGKMIGKKIGDAILAVIKDIDKAFEMIEWEKLGEKIKETILNIPWGSIFTSIVDLAKDAIGGAGGLLDGLFGTTMFSDLAETIQTIIDDIALMGETIIGTLGEGSAPGKIFKSLENIVKSISGFIRDIADTLTEWVISDEFQSVIAVVEETVGTILDLVGDVITTFTDWYNSEGGQQLQGILKTLTRIIGDGLEIILVVLKKIFEWGKWAWETFIEPVLNKVLEELNFWLDVLGDIISFIKHVFKGEWEEAFGDIKNIVSKVWEHLKESFKNMINGWIGYFERGINGIIDKLNWLPNKINKLFSSDLLKEMGIDFQVNTIGHVTLPRLETGTNRVPQDGPYYLHANEAVVPKKYNPALGGANEDTDRKLDTLIDLLSNMETTTIVNVGNDRLYKQQQRFARRQNDKYGTDVNL